MSVGSVLGFQTITGLEWLKLTYNNDLYGAIHNQQGFRGIYGPQTLDHRYIHEDIPTSLVPVTSMGHRFGISVRAMDTCDGQPYSNSNYPQHKSITGGLAEHLRILASNIAVRVN